MLDATWLLAQIRLCSGITINPITRVMPQSGYAVSLAGQELQCSDSVLEYQTLSYLRDRYHVWQLADHYFGAWYDNGTWYLDVSIVVADKNTAITIGRLNNQLSIYHIDSGTVIWL